jgi:hypothetical protein
MEVVQMRKLVRCSLTLMLLAALVPGLALAAPAPPTDPDADQLPGGQDRGVFATVCQFSHEAPDDPIVYPGQAGKSHLHTFFGNATTDAASTYDSLRTGATTCRTAEDSSGYWVPALYRNGAEVKPTFLKVYYRTGRHDPASVQAFPPGFRVVAGDSTATSAQGLRTTFWLCQRSPDLAGPQPGGPSATPLDCPADNPLTLHVLFPECWDGVSTDSPDHKGHMAYGRLGSCPADHPVVVPSLALIVHYPISGEPGAVTLASGGAYSAHADFFNAWDQAFLAKSVRDCLNAMTRCGVQR